jgi:hypothetical protein
MKVLSSIASSICSRGCARLVACLLPILAFSEDVQNATLTELASNVTAKTSLEGAAIVVEDTSHSAKTEFDGTYGLQVPLGRYTLVVEYAGLEAKMIRGTAANAAIFNIAHDFAGDPPGSHEMLTRQGLLAENHCLDTRERLFPRQARELT